jgi:hypothetical protein
MHAPFAVNAVALRNPVLHAHPTAAGDEFASMHEVQILACVQVAQLLLHERQAPDTVKAVVL